MYEGDIGCCTPLERFRWVGMGGNMGIITLPFHHTIRGYLVVVGSVFTGELVVFVRRISSFWGILKKSCVLFGFVYIIILSLFCQRG